MKFPMGGHNRLLAYTKLPRRTMRDGPGDLLKCIDYLILLTSHKSCRVFADGSIFFLQFLMGLDLAQCSASISTKRNFQ